MNDSYLIFDIAEIRINPEAFLKSEKSFFCIKYRYQGKMIEKAVNRKEDSLIIDESLYAVNGKTIPFEKIPDTQLCYYEISEGKKSKYTKIADFKPVFADEEQLKTEITLLISILKASQKTKAEIKMEVLTFLDEFYGRPDTDNVKDWLNRNFQIHIND